MDQSIGPVTLQGTGAADLAFRSMEFFEAVSTPFQFALDVVSDKPDLEAKTYLGQVLTVTLEIEGKDPRIFSGIVTEFGLHGSVGENTLYRIELRPWLSLLQLVSNCRIFQDKAVPDIVLEVLREHGFSDVEPRLSMTHPPRPYVVQYRESDFNFVCRLLEDEGIYFFFQHAPGQHIMVLCDALASHKPAPGCDKLPFFPPDANRRLTIDLVDQWQARHRVESGVHVLRDWNFEDSPERPEAKAENPAEHPQGAFEVFDYPGGYLDVGAGTPIAKRRLEELQAGRSRALGHSNARGLLVGCLLTLEKHPVKAQNKEYLLLSLTGSVRSHALESAFEGSGQEDVYACTFECIDTELPYRPPRTTPRPVVHGTQTAIVRGSEGSEIYTDEYGRIRIEFHWDRKTPGNQDCSCWVRVAQIWAGSGFGAVFIPRLEQEVLVDFLNGDPDHPIVVGSVYNSEHKPPYLPLNPTQSGIKTRSSLKGGEDNFNEIKFEDKKGEEQLFFQAEKDHTINVKNNRSASVGAGDSISVGASRSVSVTKDLSTSVGTGGAAKCNLKVTGKYDVDVSDTIEIKAKTHIQLTCGTSVLLITPDMIELTSGGKSVMRLDVNAYSESSFGSTVLLDQNACMTASESGAQLLLDKNALMTSKDGGSVFLDADATMDSGSGSAFVSGAKAVSLAGATAATINLEAAGATVSGPKVDMAATATAQVTGPVVKVN